MTGGSGHNFSLEEREAIAGIFSTRYYQAYLNGVSYVSHLLLQIFEKMGLLERLKNKHASPDELIAEFNFIPKTKPVLEWILSFLSQGGFLIQSANKDGRRYAYQEADRIDLQALLERTLELDQKILPSARLMDYVISEYPSFLRGFKKGFEILFAQDKVTLWNEYFSNDNSGYSVHNSLGAFGILKWALKGNHIRLLEVGGGTGGASSCLIDKLKEKNLLSLISEYIFSDISPIFLRLGNRAIMSKITGDFNYSLKKLDFDRPLSGQGIGEDEVDVVYGVNTLHVARRLVSALKNIRQVIKPGGIVVLSESCRPDRDYLLSQEVIFNLLDNYVNVELDDNLRPVPGFLDYEHWKRNLEAAGFKNIETVFNTDGYYPDGLSPKVGVLAAVIKAEK